MTLIETLVVVAITLLVSALAFPSMERSARSLAEVQARVQLVGDIRVARAQARRSGQPVAFSATGDGRGYRISGALRLLPDGARIGTANGSPILFQPDGSVRGDLVTLSGKGAPARIRIDGVTGVVTLDPAAR